MLTEVIGLENRFPSFIFFLNRLLSEPSDMDLFLFNKQNKNSLWPSTTSRYGKFSVRNLTLQDSWHLITYVSLYVAIKIDYH